jgi:small basic protein (TIGR04137 family)
LRHGQIDRIGVKSGRADVARFTTSNEKHQLALSRRIHSGELGVPIDKSLRRKGRLVRSRNVLKREERINQMKFEETWINGQSPLGLRKTRVVKIAAKKKKKAKEEATEEGAAATTAAPAAAAAPAGKGTAKPAAPAAKPAAKK